jgi:hypothetical protein
MSKYPGRIISATPPTVSLSEASGVWTLEEAAQYQEAGTWPVAVPGIVADPNFNQTVLLLHGDGTNGAQNNTFLDGSTNNFTITRNGNTTQGTFSPFSVGAGEWSNFFDGSGDYLDIGDNSILPNSGDFTVEMWYYHITKSIDSSIIFLEGNASSYAALRVEVIGSSTPANTNLLQILISTSGTSWAVTQSPISGSTITPNAWNHIAVVRNGGTIQIFVNGSSVYSTTSIASGTSLMNGTLNWIGAFRDVSTGQASRFVIGNISNYRVVSGTAVYTAAFTPPTAPLTAITNTSLLTCQSNRFVDNSTNAFAITRNGDVRVTPFSPFAPSAAYDPAVNGGSGYFDGTGDYLTVPDNAAFEMGADFTVEAWFYLNEIPASTLFADIVTKGALGVFQPYYIFVNSSASLLFYSSSNGTSWNVASAQSFGTVTVGQWYHVAISRSGSSLRMFLNGALINTITNSDALFDNNRAVAIGARSDGTEDAIKGYISNVRIVKGTAVYTAAFTPPTAPLTAITNTSLLCNFTNAGIFDNTGKNNLETVGNAQIDTAVKKFGTGSMEFDGTNDVLVFPQSENLSMGSGNFTYEFWINPTDNTAICIFDTRTANNNTTGFTLLLNGSSNLAIYTSSTILTCSGTISTGVWTHVAVVRSGTTLTVYSGGSSVGSVTFSNNLTDRSFRVGEYVDGTGDFTGFIDDLRITKGVARYTANFTPPTAAFEDQ